MEYQNPQLIDNIELKRFEMQFDNNLIHISYKKTKNTIELFHSESCNETIGSEQKDKLISSVLNHIKIHELKLIPSCPYVALYIMKNVEWKEYVKD
ncbi:MULTISPECIES: GNAT family N-acetyltransferase [Gelidibacter]|uniref:GNAT family N-acetyltransferase n=1 Tax=Gelidibacter TaxID=49279 RepID=UPI001FF54336|nr:MULTISPECIES: N-acetyltransferase [Gelidibacter]MCK0114564.1 N-acetyltransferase [Gelidibacter sp. F63206]